MLKICSYSSRKVTIVSSVLAQTAAVVLFMYDFGALGATLLLGGLLFSAIQILVSKNTKELLFGICVTLAPLPIALSLISSPLLIFEALFSNSGSSNLLKHLGIVIVGAGTIFLVVLMISYPLFLGTAVLKMAKVKRKKGP